MKNRRRKKKNNNNKQKQGVLKHEHHADDDHTKLNDGKVLNTKSYKKFSIKRRQSRKKNK